MRWKTIIILFVVLFAVGAGLITYLWYQARQAGGLDIVISAPDSVEIGVPFMVKVSVSNTGSGVARETSMTLSLPDGFVFMTESASKRVVAKSLGSLGEGTVTNQEFRIMPVSGENSLVQILASLSYVPTDLGSRFEKQASKEISIGESGMSLDLAVPQKVFAGETFDVKVEYENKADTDFYDLRLLLEYPRGFTFISSTLPPDEDTTLWKLGDLRAGSKGSFTIKGSMSGPDNAFFDFSVGISTSFLGKEYSVNQKTASVSLSPSPLTLSVTANNEANYIASPGETISYQITYRNNTNLGLKDAIITAKLVGAMFEMSETDSRDGVYRSGDNSVQWNAARVSELALIRPGDGGSVSFTARVRQEYPIKRISDKNFSLKVSAEIESPTVPVNVASNRTIGSTSLETKVRGTLRPSVTAFYKDNSGIKNSGPIPLRVGQPTTFNMHWILKNEATDMDEVTLKTFLGPNVRYTGQYKATNEVAPQYNERTQELIWLAGKINATKGVIDAPVELVFQVEIIPSSNQINQFPALIGETTVTATDLFVSKSFFDKLQPFTTILINDQSLSSQDKQVNP